MTRTIMRSAVLLGLGLTLTACAQHNPARANCFNFREHPRRRRLPRPRSRPWGPQSRGATRLAIS